MKKLTSLVILSSIVSSSISTIATAASNPVDERTVGKTIAAATTVSSADWNNLCSTDTLAEISTTGCHGPIDSVAFKKIDKFTNLINSTNSYIPSNAYFTLLRLPVGQPLTGYTFHSGNLTIAGSTHYCYSFFQNGTNATGLPAQNTFGTTTIYNSVITSINTSTPTSFNIPIFANGATSTLSSTIYALCVANVANVSSATLTIY